MMKRRIVLCLASVAMMSLSATVPTAAAQAQQGAAPATPADGRTTVPRTANGKPDLSGVWLAGGFALLLGEEEAAKIRRADAAIGRPVFQQEPPPYRPEAAAKRQAYLDRRGIDDPMARCLLSGVPRITVRPLPFEIIQLPDRVVILYEVHHAFRIIPTDGRPHPDDLEPSYLGDSVGHWEGDTLVVDVVGFNTDTWLAGVGTIHSDKLRVTERYTRDTADTVVYDVTIEDPEVFTKPWKQQAIFRLRPGERIREYECIENNEDIVRWEKLLETDPAFKTPRP
jgi:hypothetical protein